LGRAEVRFAGVAPHLHPDASRRPIASLH